MVTINQQEQENLFHRYVLSNIKLEQELYLRRMDKVNDGNKLSAYFQSTPTKNIVGKYLVAGAMDVNLLYTCTQIATLSACSKTAVCKIANDCIEAGWAEEVMIQNVRHVRATDVHVQAYQDYTIAVMEARNRHVTDYCAAQKLLAMA